jgi:GST-like protein
MPPMASRGVSAIREESAMIILYTQGSSPNGQKVSVMLREAGLAYRVQEVDLRSGEQFAPEFLRINPNAVVPAIVDEDNGATVFESSAILLYLAEKSGKLVPADLRGRADVYKWLMFEAATMSPMAGELYHYECEAAEANPYALSRCQERLIRCATILENQLRGREYLCGDYSIADIALYPWVSMLEDFTPARLSDYPELSRWIVTLGRRVATLRDMTAAPTEQE